MARCLRRRARLGSTLSPLAVCVLVAATEVQVQEGRFFDSNGVKIHYVDHGEGEPEDARGHGESDKPHDPDLYGAQMAEDILRLMDHLEISKAHVIGYSMGARLTGYVVANHPDRLLTATLGASSPRRRWDEAAQERARNMSEGLEERGRAADPSDDRDYAALAAIPRSWPSQVVSDAQLAASTVPILAIVGSEDPRLPELEELKTVMPTLKLLVPGGALTCGGWWVDRRRLNHRRPTLRSPWSSSAYA